MQFSSSLLSQSFGFVVRSGLLLVSLHLGNPQDILTESFISSTGVDFSHSVVQDETLHGIDNEGSTHYSRIFIFRSSDIPGGHIV